MSDKKASLALYCYSKEDFEKTALSLGWKKEPGPTCAVISIGCTNEYERPHMYNNDTPSVLNVDFDDVSPETWWNESDTEVDHYDETMNMYIRERQKESEHTESNKMFWKVYEDKNDEGEVTGKTVIHAMDYEQADKMERFIEQCVEKNLHIYVHCAAGASRSQAVVRYILDTYQDVHWMTRQANPCRTPNIHVVRMLKRAHIFNNEQEELPEDIVDDKQEDIWQPMTRIIPEVRIDSSTNEEYVIYRLLVRGQEFELRGADVIGISMDAHRALSMTKEEIKNLKKDVGND
jgi:predicted protein tyrosine phosphatase